ncbi:MAG: phosphoglycolate phosphatase, partial [Burkholderiales bacterium]|nr:phosphoglycolate phosphatase [Burkholderiales bacterium]
MIEAVLFDLDGTLADTAPDLGYALNRQRVAHGMPPLPVATIRPHVSRGGRGLVHIGFALTPEESGYTAMRDEFLSLYAENICRETTLFPGMAELLDEIEKRGLPWGIVTNKPARFTGPLIAALGLQSRAACVISGDTCGRAKPYPDPLLAAAAQLGTAPAACVYVGDDERDVQAARAAGMQIIVALYGYLGD